MKILNCKSCDPKTNTGTKTKVQSKHKKYKGNMLENLLLKNYSATICGITMEASVAKLVNMTPNYWGFKN